MKSAMSLDSDFVMMATPVLSEFGFGSIKDLVKDQLSLMLQSKIDHYESESKVYESRFGTSYSEVSANNRKSKIENFDMEDALNDWRFAQEAVTLYCAKLRDIQNA